MTSLRIFPWLLAAAGSVAFAADRTLPSGSNGSTGATPPSLPQRFQSEAERVLGQVTSTTYRHRTRVVEAAGVYETDCKGLIAFLLRKVSPAHLEVLPVAAGRRKPRAVEYYEFFRGQSVVGEISQTGWDRVPRLVDAQPGDVLAWRYREIVLGKNTGHVLILDAKPERAGDDVFRVAVIDATGTPHDDDTRARGSTGIGKGTMWFKVNADGEPVAYKRNSEAGFKGAPIAIGRMGEK